MLARASPTACCEPSGVCHAQSSDQGRLTPPFRNSSILECGRETNRVTKRGEVDEEAARRGVSLRFINPKQHDNAVLGGDPNCTELAPPQAKRQGKKHGHGKKHGDA